MQSNPGDGGGGAFMIIAPDGVYFSGTGMLGDGGGVVFGTLTNTGSFPDGSPEVDSYSTWSSASIDSYWISGGSGGGGAGGDGQGTNSIGLGGGLAVIAPQSPSGGSNRHTHHASWSDLDSGTVVRHLGFVATANDRPIADGFQPEFPSGSYATTWTIIDGLSDSTDLIQATGAANTHSGSHSRIQRVDALFADLLGDIT